VVRKELLRVKQIGMRKTSKEMRNLLRWISSTLVDPNETHGSLKDQFETLLYEKELVRQAIAPYIFDDNGNYLE
jgi:hypothetical protein